MIKKLKSKEFYLKQPWVFEFEYIPEDNAYTAEVKGLSCYSNGKTMDEATKNIREALEFHIEGMLECGKEPIPIDEDKATGRLNIRTSKSIHLKLLKKSMDEDVSVSHLINDAIVKQYG
jgi:predicted RNase H-like HicB family nuclease